MCARRERRHCNNQVVPMECLPEDVQKMVMRNGSRHCRTWKGIPAENPSSSPMTASLQKTRAKMRMGVMRTCACTCDHGHGRVRVQHMGVHICRCDLTIAHRSYKLLLSTARPSYCFRLVLPHQIGGGAQQRSHKKEVSGELR